MRIKIKVLFEKWRKFICTVKVKKFNSIDELKNSLEFKEILEQMNNSYGAMDKAFKTALIDIKKS